MKVVILCGGLGTRLREETEYHPKPMVEIGGRPILWHIMKIYSYYGYNEFVLCLGYKGDVIRRYFLDYDMLNCDVTLHLGTGQVVQHERAHDERDWSVTLAETGQATMTAGRIQRIMQYVNTDTFMVTYGDAVADIRIPDLLEHHKRLGRVATLTAIQPPSRFGHIDFDEDENSALGFTEKPVGTEGWVNGGFFVFDRRIDEYIEGDESVLEQGPLTRLSEAGQLSVYRHRGFWHCIDTIRDVEQIRGIWASGEAPWAIWRRPSTPHEVPTEVLQGELATPSA